ncbi:penicillin-binding protein 2 [Methylohalomonas lacus]|uniref:Peptidoglycan D,D-transpeptidase MrdA n=2 Tax=Methylohalomonas lacus TaxID=398773 RepID=A0AAE3HJ14_9GAMM|nr:penicillin-binding protein 2 [Methylohalomonas lacus]
MVLLVSRIAYIQIVRHDHFTTLSQDNRVKILPVAPTRGLIYSRDGVLLAENQPSYNLELIPERINNLDRTIERLGQIVAIDQNDVDRFYDTLKRIRRFERVPLRLNLTDAEVARFAVRRHEFPGADVSARLKREYPLGELTSHVIGYVGRIDKNDQKRIDLANYSGTSHIGKTGVERSYEDQLHGKVGYEQVEVNAAGRVLRVLDRTPPVSGKNVRLTLDISLQRAAQEALSGRRGSIVAIDPRNGEVLAMVSNPGYDANLFVDGIRPAIYNALRDSPDRPLFNRALMGQYPPGSTLKPFVGLAGLEYDVRVPDTDTWCPGWFSLPNSSHRYRCWKKHGHGQMNLNEAIAQSCDVYFYSLANDLGIERMHEFLERFGFNKKSGIEIGPESDGNVPSRQWKKRVYGQPWYPGETVIAGIGQGAMLATPMQLASATAILANHGKVVTPHLLEETYDPVSGEVIKDYEPKESRIELTEPADWGRIEQAMRDVVHGDRGTARRIGQGADYEIAGKTGTAQVIGIAQGEEYDEETVLERHRDHALFVAYAPVEEPRLAVAIIVENGGSGSGTAAPMARAIFDHALMKTDD